MMKAFLESSPLVLMEAAVAERLAKLPDLTLHPQLYHTPFIYQADTAERLAEIYRDYLRIAREADLPMLIAAPTWRLDPGRVANAGVPETINTDAVLFVKGLVSADARVRVGGLLGPANDCYSPELSLSAQEAETFHRPQARELAAAGVDYLLGQTLPSVSEAIGMARAAAATGIPSLISFCINPEGQVLDGTPLGEAIRLTDEATGGQLLGYMANCCYPDFLHPEQISPPQLKRFIGFDANGSSRVPWELEDAGQTIAEPVTTWAKDMLTLHRNHGIRLLGGCCGTASEHLNALVTHWASE